MATTSTTITVAPSRVVGKSRPWWRIAFSFPAFLGAMLVIGVFACARTTPSDPDTWWHISVGSQILRTGTWPTNDAYSFTAAGSPWTAYEWLGEVVLGEAWKAGEMQGEKLLLIALAAIFMLLLYSYGTLVSGNSKASFISCTALLPLDALYFTLRPQLIGYTFLVILMIFLELFRRGKSWAIWLLPPLFLIWVNTHGSFAFGFFILAVFWLSGLVALHFGGIEAQPWTPSQRLNLECAGLASLVATFLTPYGTRLFSYPLQMALLQSVNVKNIVEWQSLNTNLVMGKWFTAIIILFLLVEILFHPTHRLDYLFLLLFTIVVASLHRRFLVVFLVIFTPWLATFLSRWVPPFQPEKDKPALNAALIILGIAGLVLFFPTPQALAQATAKNYPVRAVTYLNTHPTPVPMLNEYGWGGYLIFRRGPEHKVFIDGRADIYDYSGVLSDYQDMTLLKPNAMLLLRKYRIRSCLLRRNAPLRTVLAELPDWKIVYQDDISTILVKRQASRSTVVSTTGKDHPVRMNSIPPRGA
jgi:hypothetical protein